jgi:hypothetical protein
VALIQLLSKHKLYISESGLIARYGKTKERTTSTQTRWQQFVAGTKEFFHKNFKNLVWLLLYMVLNLAVFSIGVGVYSRRDSLTNTWRLWALGTGLTLSMNCVLILLPVLSSLIHAMSNSQWLSKVRRIGMKWNIPCSLTVDSLNQDPNAFL